MQTNSNKAITTLAVILVVMGCLGVFAVFAGCYLTYRLLVVDNILGFELTLRATPTAITAPPTRVPTSAAKTATPLPYQTPTTVVYSPESALQTLKTLSEAMVPNNDPRQLAARLKGIEGIPEVLDQPAREYQIGDTEQFWVVNGDTDIYSQIKARLAYATPHLYFWIQEGIKYKNDELEQLCLTFENEIYPTNREFFGSEWTPGIDGDVHLYVIYTKGLGSRVAGYFSSADSLHPLASKYSNAHETFVMNAASMSLSDQFIYTVLAHEFQHMIHWYRDRNETSWLNEGFSELAAFLNGYDVGGHDYAFAQNPDLQLNDWPNDRNKTLPHYGASFLFVNYFLERFGSDATQQLVANPANGLESVDEVIKQQGAVDPISMKEITADVFFVDWTLTNYLNDNTVGDGRFSYENYASTPGFKDSEIISRCPSDILPRTVNQYGVDYLRLTCRGEVTLQFKGAQEVGVLPASAHSGKMAFWSNKGDESNMTLTRTFDLTEVQNSATLTYWTWYDLEENYDYVHLSVSEDGERWQILKTPSGTDKNISGNSYGWGYNGTTVNWIKESVDLSAFLGKKVQVRFDYITDAAVNGEGFLLDDISVPEINYHSDFEDGEDGWDARGFVRIENRLPQTYRISLIRLGDKPEVEYLALSEDQSLSLDINLKEDVVIVISATARFTRIPARYEFGVQK